MAKSNIRSFRIAVNARLVRTESSEVLGDVVETAAALIEKGPLTQASANKLTEQPRNAFAAAAMRLAVAGGALSAP